jgi:hypothetical protein
MNDEPKKTLLNVIMTTDPPPTDGPPRINWQAVSDKLRCMPDDQLGALHSMVRELSGDDPSPSPIVKAARAFAKYWRHYASR